MSDPVEEEEAAEQHCHVRSEREKREESHCNCWWDGEKCCACGARGMTEEEKRAQGMDD